MSNAEENKKQAAEKLRQLANGNIPETNISFSYEGTAPENKYWWIPIPIAILSIIVSVISILLKLKIL